MRGGARARSGPPPDPNALRRDRDSETWTVLPLAGRKGAAPAWPLDGKSKREAALWKKEWSRPQAVEWERNGQEVEVAMYVRTLIASEKLDATQGMRNLLRQQQEALGLSLPGLARNHWRIEEAEKKPQGSARATSNKAEGQSNVVSIEDRLKRAAEDAG